MTDRTITAVADLDALTFNEAGLIPVIAQDAASGTVLMMAWANREALEKTLDSGLATFWSRSRQDLWTKGETSGNKLAVVSLHGDCDSDALLVRVNPSGPACHTGETTCFGEGSVPAEVANGSPAAASEPSESTIPGVWATLVSRAQERPEGSYTVKLLDNENLRIKKLGEETAEFIQALVKGQNERAAEEAGDLFYHMLAALLANGVTLDDVLAELESRR